MPDAGGKYSVEFRLWDVFGGAEMFSQSYRNFSPDIWRRVAHIIADDIYQRITGEEGYFDTRIVYIAESGPKDNRQKRLAIMDQDGENHQFLTNGADLVLTPRFSPAAQDITFMSYYGNKPRVYLFSISTGQQEVLGDFPGMTFAPRYSPDGNSVIMSLAQRRQYRHLRHGRPDPAVQASDRPSRVSILRPPTHRTGRGSSSTPTGAGNSSSTR